jgi:hypothetical protein
MRGCVLRHARSIGANESGSNFGTGWAVGWVVWSSNPCKLLKELVGASGFEPPTSWSRTRRSTRLSHAPKIQLYHARCPFFRALSDLTALMTFPKLRPLTASTKAFSAGFLATAPGCLSSCAPSPTTCAPSPSPSVGISRLAMSSTPIRRLEIGETAYAPSEHHRQNGPFEQCDP